MTKYRDSLPQLSNAFFLTDGGIETTLIFHEGLDLPHFAAFHLLKDKAGYEALRKYFRTYAALAKRYETGLVLESPTWRANPDWASKLGYGAKHWPKQTARRSTCSVKFGKNSSLRRRPW
jgi:hypothetical protein